MGFLNKIKNNFGEELNQGHVLPNLLMKCNLPIGNS